MILGESQHLRDSVEFFTASSDVNELPKRGRNPATQSLSPGCQLLVFIVVPPTPFLFSNLVEVEWFSPQQTAKCRQQIVSLGPRCVHETADIRNRLGE